MDCFRAYLRFLKLRKPSLVGRIDSFDLSGGLIPAPLAHRGPGGHLAPVVDQSTANLEGHGDGLEEDLGAVKTANIAHTVYYSSGSSCNTATGSEK